jgi:hypothetical protein
LGDPADNQAGVSVIFARSLWIESDRRHSPGVATMAHVRHFQRTLLSDIATRSVRRCPFGSGRGDDLQADLQARDESDAVTVCNTDASHRFIFARLL